MVIMLPLSRGYYGNPQGNEKKKGLWCNPKSLHWRHCVAMSHYYVGRWEIPQSWWRRARGFPCNPNLLMNEPQVMRNGLSNERSWLEYLKLPNDTLHHVELRRLPRKERSPYDSHLPSWQRYSVMPMVSKPPMMAWRWKQAEPRGRRANSLQSKWCHHMWSLQVIT